MKKTVNLILLLIFFNSCGTLDKTKSIGNNKDKYGCLVSAGYTWSVLKEDCVKIFETGQRLNSVDTNQTSSSFFIINKDESKLELFLPNEESSIILTKNKDGNFTKDDFLFNTNQSILSLNGKIIYTKN